MICFQVSIGSVVCTAAVELSPSDSVTASVVPTEPQQADVAFTDESSRIGEPIPSDVQVLRSGAEAVRAGPAEGTTRDTDAQARPRRPDSRAAKLARYLAAVENPSSVRGEMVRDILGIDIAPRTGRRLLGQARELLAGR